jgi:hypothetical protein
MRANNAAHRAIAAIQQLAVRGIVPVRRGEADRRVVMCAAPVPSVSHQRQ